MTAVVVDASVGAKWFLNETESAKARALLGAGLDLKAPALLRQEAASSIVRAYRTSRLSRADAETALSAASQMLSSAAVELVPTERVQARAEEIALDLKHALADCLYVALAESEACDLLTTDAKLLARAAAHFPFVKLL